MTERHYVVEIRRLIKSKRGDYNIKVTTRKYRDNSPALGAVDSAMTTGRDVIDARVTNLYPKEQV